MQTEINGKKIAHLILAGENAPSNVDGRHGRDIIAILKKKGAKPEKMYSTCTVASYEDRVKLPDGRVVTVIESNFMGAFTDIQVWPA